MRSVCLYFQVHQPFRLRHYTFFDIGRSRQYDDEDMNRSILRRVTAKCYGPAGRLLLDLIREYKGEFRVAFSISGTALDQFERYSPAALSVFQRLADSGAVEFLGETSHHSLAFQFSLREFRDQVSSHRQRIGALFGQRPRIFRNTELIYSNAVAREIERLGYRAILAEGVDRILGERSAGLVYRPRGCNTLRLLLKNHRLSDDVAFRFSDRAWAGYPLTSEKFCGSIRRALRAGGSANLFMDFETFGEHQWKSTGIFTFLRQLPAAVLRSGNLVFQTPSEVIRDHEPAGDLDVPDFTSWADEGRDLTAWMGNDMQHDALHSLYALERCVRKPANKTWLPVWRKLQTSDHFYYMSTKWFADGDVHKYFNPYQSPYDAYINYMNIISDLSERLGGSRARRKAAPMPRRLRD